MSDSYKDIISAIIVIFFLINLYPLLVPIDSQNTLLSPVTYTLFIIIAVIAVILAIIQKFNEYI